MTRNTVGPSSDDTSVFLVETPLQLLNAIEARHYFPVRQAHLRILTSPPFSQAAFVPLLTDGDWSSTHFAPIRATQPQPASTTAAHRRGLAKLTEYRNYADQAYRRYLLNHWARALRCVDSVFLGGFLQPYMKHFANVLPHRRLVALDDGTDTLRVTRDRLRAHPAASPTGIARVKALAHALLHDWDIREPESVTFFSAYDLQTSAADQLIRNDYAHVRTRALCPRSSHDVLFLGQPLVEDGYLRFDDYVRHLVNAVAVFGPVEVTYAPHPREAAANVEWITRNTGIRVARSDLPVEVDLACRSGKPRHLASFFCSALENCRLIFKADVTITAFRLPSGDLLTAREFVDDIYRYFEAHASGSFRVIPLPVARNQHSWPPADATAPAPACVIGTSRAPRPMISVVIPTFNAARYLAQTLDSVLAQARVSTELIVVDDCSTDNTQDVLRHYAGHVKSVCLETNHGGPARPRNVGVQLARGECIALLDGDDVMLPGKLAEQYDLLRRHADIPLVFTNFRNFSDQCPQQEDFLSTHRLFQQMPKEPLDHAHYRIRCTNAFETLLGDNFIGTSGVVFRASLARTIGLFDESLRNSDDLDWWFRLTKTHDLGYIDKIYHRRRVHPDNISSRPSALHARLEVYRRRRPDASSPRAKKNLHESLSDNYFSVGYQQRLAGRRLSPLWYYSLSWRYSKGGVHIARSMLAALLQLRPRPEREPYAL